jgi:hypothetical protein
MKRKVLDGIYNNRLGKNDKFVENLNCVVW